MKSKIALQLMAFSTLCSAVGGCGMESDLDPNSVAGRSQALLNYAAEFKDMSTFRDNGYDWDAQRGKASCAIYETIAAMSEIPGDAARKALCKYHNGYYTGGVQAVLTLDDNADQRLAQRNDDWAYGYYKLECGWGQFVSGVSENMNQHQGNNHFHAIRCNSGVYLGSSCTTRTFDGGDDRGNTDTSDWDVGAYKGECAVNEYVVGVSVHPSTRRPHSLLCCGTTPSGGGGHMAAP